MLSKLDVSLVGIKVEIDGLADDAPTPAKHRESLRAIIAHATARLFALSSPEPAADPGPDGPGEGLSLAGINEAA